ncbi:hypothetical protein AOQ73_06075 [Bradyrhizobium pachyrhizi]|uniref:DUF2800 domain-containing protein n=1 Tax=Bradyrhizobium pachyrhizi TaxID=280333 RepID=UPI0007054E31|nr:DUF2800 domain-containing protein [Bradyrhizobium pachyrhizi]KRQ11640.1 hypothetical protein AOQ73_06075 [Bradyrhizobium pachyrhizi]
MNAHTNITAAHAVYAPSSAHRWAMEGGCSASAEAIAHLGEQEEGEEAAEGTAAHDEIERVLSPLVEYGLAELDEQSREHPAAYGVALVFDYVRQLIRPMSTGDKIWIEQRVRLTDQIWGRCDVAHWNASTAILTIIDYKNGYVGVDAEENEQLRIYAAGSIYTHNLPVKWVRYAVVQPNDFRPVPRVKQWFESAGSLFTFAQRVAAIPAGPKNFVAGEQCTYCPLFGKCPASRDILRDVAALVAGLMTPDQVTPAQRALFMACKKPIADAFKNAEKAWAKLQMSGNGSTDLKMVVSQTHRAWNNPVEARAAILAKLGTDGLDPPTPAQAIERGMDEATVNGLASKPEGAPVLAFANDKRPEYVRKSVSDMFGAAIRGGQPAV